MTDQVGRETLWSLSPQLYLKGELTPTSGFPISGSKTLKPDSLSGYLMSTLAVRVGTRRGSPCS